MIGSVNGHASGDEPLKNCVFVLTVSPASGVNTYWTLSRELNQPSLFASIMSFTGIG